MSTLSVSNITDGTDTVGTSYVVNGSAKAWARWNQIANTLVKTQNVSSYTDVATGYSRLTFTNSMSDADYSVTACSGELTGGGNRSIGVNGNGGRTPTVSIVSFYNFNSSGSDSDDSCLNMSIHGDLA